MAAPPIYNPVIPTVQAIPGGLFPGRMIRIQGSTFPTSDRFALNLQCGPNTDPRDDIALHLNVRFEQMCIVRNNLVNMNWGPEDIDGGMPIARGQAFEVLLLCEPQSIKVAFNGAHFCEFVHRTPFQRISHLTIDGDVNIQFIGFEGAQPPPSYQPPVGNQGGYGNYGPPPGYGPGYEAPMYAGGVAPVQGMPGGPMVQQRSGMGTGAAVGLGVGALAAGGLAGYALGGGFSSNDSPREESYQDQGGGYRGGGYQGYPGQGGGYQGGGYQDRRPGFGGGNNCCMMLMACVMCLLCSMCQGHGASGGSDFGGDEPDD